MAPSRFQVVPASYVLLLREGADGDEVLLQLRHGTGYRDGHWSAAAAGHVEAGESCVDAARRELAEEVGVVADAADVVPLTTLHRTSGTGDPYDERADFFFTCRRWTGEPQRLETAKTADLRWFPLTALPAPVPPQEAFVLEALALGSVPPFAVFGFPGGPGYPPEDGRTPLPAPPPA